MLLKSRVNSRTRTIQRVLREERGDAEENLFSMRIGTSHRVRSLEGRIGRRPESPRPRRSRLLYVSVLAIVGRLRSPLTHCRRCHSQSSPSTHVRGCRRSFARASIFFAARVLLGGDCVGFLCLRN